MLSVTFGLRQYFDFVGETVFVVTEVGATTLDWGWDEDDAVALSLGEDIFI